MNITQESTGKLEALIKIGISREDYQEKVSKELKSFQRKANIPGFRPGKVPFSMIQKMYGKGVLVEEVNKILSDALYQYIRDNKLNILGYPVADTRQAATLDWDKLDEGFTFNYRIGLAPDISLELGPDIQVDYHNIAIDDHMLEGYITDIRRKYGKMTSPGEAAAGDVVYGKFEEMLTSDEVKPEGIDHESSIYIDLIKDEETRNKLLGSKPGESFVFDIMKAVESEAEASAMIGVKREELGNYNLLFRFTTGRISRLEPSEVNAELYEKVVPGQDIRSEEAFRELIRADVKRQYQHDVDKHFKNEVRRKLIEMTALDLPEDFLKTWLLENNEKLTADQADTEYANLSDVFRWQLIENHLIKTHNLDVSQQEIHQYLDGYFRNQMKQYGQDDIEEDVVEGFIRNITSKEDEIKKVTDHLMEQKFIALFMQQLSLKEVELSVNEFVALVTEKYNHGQETDNDSAEPQTEPAREGDSVEDEQPVADASKGQ